MTVLPGRRYPELINDDETVAGELVRGARRGAGRCAGVAAGAGRTDPWRGGVGRERECAARSVRDGVRAVLLHPGL